MREFAKISPQQWTSELGRKIKKLGIEARVVSLYLQTNPCAHMTGIYYIPVVLIAHESGLNLDQVTDVLNKLSKIGYCSYDYEYEYVWVYDMGIDQVAAQLKPNDNRVKAINTYYTSLPKLTFLQEFHAKYAELFCFENDFDFSPLQAPLNNLRSNEKENEKDNENEKEKKNILSGEPDVHTLNSNYYQKQSLKSQAIEVIDFLNDKTNRAYRPVESNLKLIVSCLKSGATVDDCRQVIAKKSREWKTDSKMSEYLRPATLFNRVKFEQYLGELVLPKEEQNHVM